MPGIVDTSKLYWKSKVDAVHRHSDEEWFSRYAEEILAIMPRGGTLLDVGCGSCQVTTYLSKFYERIIGFDSSEAMLRAGRERVNQLDLQNIELSSGDAVAFPWQATLANVILAFGVIQYLDCVGLERHLLECKRHLKPGGAICWGLVPDRALQLLWDANALKGDNRSLPGLLVAIVQAWCRRNSPRTRTALWDGIGTWYSREVLINLCRKHDASVEFRRAWYYEYRYHALVRFKV